MKKIISLLVVLAFTVSVMTSCGSILQYIPEELLNALEQYLPDGGNTGNGGNSGNGENHTTSDDHVDNDNNGYCDDCGTYVIVVLDIYAVNDLHGKFNDAYGIVGVGGLTTYLKTKMAADDNAILLSSGDMWQGSAHSNLTKGNVITEWMNHMNFVSMTMGNHEYDWGRDYIEANAALAEFPFLGINIYDTATNQRISYCKPSVVVERGGLRIGIIGATGDVYDSVASYMNSGFQFKTGSSLASLIRAEATRLRNEENVDFVILSIHDGYDNNQDGSGIGYITNSNLSSYYDISLSRGDVDIVFEGHTHRSYVLEDTNGVLHMQGGGDNSGITHAEISINLANGKNEVNEAEVVNNSKYKNYAVDPVVDELIQKYYDQIGWVDNTIGAVSTYQSSSQLKKLVAQLYYEKGVELWGDEYDIILAGGSINARSPYNIPAGNVTFAQIVSIFPFDNPLSLAKISGKDLKRVFIKNSRYTYYCPPEKQAKLNSIVDTQYYYVVTDRYSSAYAYNKMTEVMILNQDIYAYNLLAEHIKKGKLK